jgi:hypothetical protein
MAVLGKTVAPMVYEDPIPTGVVVIGAIAGIGCRAAVGEIDYFLDYRPRGRRQNSIAYIPPEIIRLMCQAATVPTVAGVTRVGHKIEWVIQPGSIQGTR